MNQMTNRSNRRSLYRGVSCGADREPDGRWLGVPVGKGDGSLPLEL